MKGIFPSKSQLSEGEIAQMNINEKCRKLRERTAPPRWMDQSEEGIRRWRSM